MKTRLATIVLVLCLVSAGAPPFRVYLPFVARGVDMTIGYEIITADNVTVDLTIAGINVNPGIPDGFGLPPVTHIAKTVYGLPGGVLDSININARVVTLACSMTATSQEALHAVRKILWSPLRWNRTLVSPPQPARLRYTANSKSVDLYVHYLADVIGNAGSADNLQLVGIRLIAYDPIWYDDAAVSAGLAVGQSLTVNYIVQRISSVWTSIDVGADDVVYCISIAPDGTLYAGGFFHNIGGIAAAHIAKWNGSAWSALGTGADDDVYSIAIAPDGTLYAGGLFHNIGGVAAVHIAKWNGSAWSALGTGADNNVYFLTFASDGALYAGGAFHNIGGVAADHIAKFNGTIWSPLGAGADDYVDALAIAPDGTLYAGGTFHNAGGIAAVHIAKWNGSAWSALGAGVDAVVYSIFIALDGTLYAGGAFHNAGGIAAAHIAKWNGTTWSALGAGVDNDVYSLHIPQDGLLYVGGVFTTAGGISLADRLAAWNGSAWNQLDINLPGTPIVIAINSFGDSLYLGFNTSGTAFVPSSITSSVTNSGTFDARPVFTVTGPGTLSWIENVTTGKRMIFNCYLNAGETATITPKLATFTSDWRGDLLPYAALLPQSDFGDFALAPAPIAPAGVNSIAVMMTGTTPVVQNDNAGTAGAAQLDDWENITGVDCDNTASGGRMYVKIIDDTGGYFHVALYDAAAMATGDLVGHTATYNSTGAKAIVADNTSGLGGTLTVDEALAADADIIVFFATACESHYDAYLTADDGV